MKNLLIVSLTALLLAACAKTPTNVVDSNPIERPRLIVPSVDRFDSRTVKWIVITPENVDQVFADLQDSGSSIVLFALTDTGYENISLNIADIAKLVKQQQSIIAAYRQYYEEEK